MKKIRVGFLSAQNQTCLDRSVWSGISYYMQAALKRRDLEIIYIGDLRQHFYWRQLISPIWKHKSAATGSPRFVKEYTKFVTMVEKQLARTPCDVIFAPVAARELMFLETKIPIISFSDVTFELLHQAYGLKVDEEEYQWEMKKEALAIAKSSRSIYSSEWAANSAINDYQANPSKVSVIPFGANLDDIPADSEEFLKRQTDCCRLLFVGKGWERKGGDLAFQTLLALEKKGMNVELTVVGNIPPAEVRHDRLTIIPYLNKRDHRQRQQLRDLFLQANFFIFPTRADCSPIVLSEANAFGLPVITTDTGGISSIISNGENGYMLPLSALAEEYADLIAEVFSDQVSYQNLVRSSRQEYDARLNWDRWAESIHAVMLDLLDGK